jgi:hypothetical protein
VTLRKAFGRDLGKTLERGPRPGAAPAAAARELKQDCSPGCHPPVVLPGRGIVGLPLGVRDHFLVCVFQKFTLQGREGQRSVQVRPDLGFSGEAADAEVVNPEFLGPDVRDFEIIAQALVGLNIRVNAVHFCGAFERPGKGGRLRDQAGATGKDGDCLLFYPPRPNVHPQSVFAGEATGINKRSGGHDPHVAKGRALGRSVPVLYFPYRCTGAGLLA